MNLNIKNQGSTQTGATVGMSAVMAETPNAVPTAEIWDEEHSSSRIAGWLWVLSLAGFLLSGHGSAASFSSYDGQQKSSPNVTRAGNRTISALLVGDIHFDPFHDPGKVQQLAVTEVSQWSSILSAPPSPNQEQAFTSLQQSCDARGVDTPYALLHSSLQEMRSREPNAKFIVVSGDLIAHLFSCRYAARFPASTPSDYQVFVVKTIRFVAEQLRASFPGVPVYLALGNNDSGCGDYRLDAGSEFLARTGGIVAEGVPPSDRDHVLTEFAAGGYYSVTMEAPVLDTRLIVINDLFLSPKYRTCAGASDSTASTAQMAWLQEQLAQARRLHQKVWILGHIPPGVDVYSTMAELKDFCGDGSPEVFLSSGKLTDLLIEYADVVRLGIFAHSHMDEMHLLEPEGSTRGASLDHSVAIKLLPSISPVYGNNPSFTVARVNPSSAVLQNYEVIAASNQSGVATSWREEYSFAGSYHKAQFSPSTAKELINGFEDDRQATTEASKEYIRNFYVGDHSLCSSALKPWWPLYVCSLASHTAKGFASCGCSLIK